MLNLYKLPKWVERVPHHTGEIGDKYNGCFLLASNENAQETLRVIASSDSDDTGWDHLSVSLYNRCPTWSEMEFIKKLFLGDVIAYQLHLPSKDHINIHPYVLHIWRPWRKEIPLPPTSYV